LSLQNATSKKLNPSIKFVNFLSQDGHQHDTYVQESIVKKSNNTERDLSAALFHFSVNLQKWKIFKTSKKIVAIELQENISMRTTQIHTTSVPTCDA